jgi:hypothetical protein
MALLIVTGSVKGAMTRVQSGSSAEHAGDGDVVLNAAAVSLLERLSGMSLAQAHRPTEEHAASLFVGNASVTFAKEGCVMTAFPLDFGGSQRPFLWYALLRACFSVNGDKVSGLGSVCQSCEESVVGFLTLTAAARRRDGHCEAAGGHRGGEQAERGIAGRGARSGEAGVRDAADAGHQETAVDLVAVAEGGHIGQKKAPAWRRLRPLGGDGGDGFIMAVR